MIKVLSPLLALAMGISIAACGTGSGTTTAAPATGTSSAAATASSAAGSAKASTQQLATQTQQVLRQISAQAGVLATGNSAREKQARQKLQQLHARANSLAATAESKLAPTNPARTVIAQVNRQAGIAATDLQHATSSSATQTRMQQAQSSLSKLASQVGQVKVQIRKTNVNKITADLKSVANLLGNKVASATSSGG